MSKNIANNHYFMWNKILFFLMILVYVILGAFLIQFYRYQINFDGIMYISIAKKYAHGDFYNAINGCWGPLFSLLLVPFIKFNVDPLLSAKILNLILGIFILCGIRLLSYRFQINNTVITIITLVSIPIIWSFAFSYITPDLLLLCFLIYYLYIIFNPFYLNHFIKNNILCGIIGGFAYSTKHFAFPFFITHFFLMNLIFFISVKSKKGKINLIKGLIIGYSFFFLLSGIYIFAIYNKYQIFNYNTITRFAKYMNAPWVKDINSERGFIVPPNNSIYAGEDPFYLEYGDKTWSPLNSWFLFNYKIKKIIKNFNEQRWVLERFSYMSLILLFVYLFISYKNIITKKYNSLEFLTSLTILLYMGGYMYGTVHNDDRYYWIIYILLLLISGNLISATYNKFNITKPQIIFLSAITFLTFCNYPYQALKNNHHDNYLNVFNLSKELKDKYGIKGNIASNDEFNRSLFIAYYIDCKYFGISLKYKIEEILDKILEFKIDYYLIWNNKDSNSILESINKEAGKKYPPIKLEQQNINYKNGLTILHITQ